MSVKRFREEEVCLSREVYRLLKIIARTVNSGREESSNYITIDQTADNILREQIAVLYPELVAMYPEYEKAANASKKLYEDAEAKMIEAVRKAKVAEAA